MSTSNHPLEIKSKEQDRGTVTLDRPQGATPEEPSPCLAPAQASLNHPRKPNPVDIIMLTI